MSEMIYIGIDLGGTSIKLGAVNGKGELLQVIEERTPLGKGHQPVIDTFDQMVKQLIIDNSFEWENIKGIGIGIPGFVDIETGEIIEAPNLKWKHVHIKKELEKQWNIPVEVENDANAAALGEMWVGAGVGASHILCLTIGTGIGGGIIIGGNIHHGVNGMAGEIGHFIINDEDGKLCNCGKRGCLETEVSATAIVNDAMEEVKKGTSKPLTVAYEQNGEISARTVVELAKDGDPVCKHIIAHNGEVIGKTLSKFCVLLNPEKIVIGGGVSHADDLIFKPMIDSFKQHALSRIEESTSIVQAKLGNTAGMIGAAWLIHKKHQ